MSLEYEPASEPLHISADTRSSEQGGAFEDAEEDRFSLPNLRSTTLSMRTLNFEL